MSAAPPPAGDPNAAQIAFWNGPVGERWASEQARLDRAFVPLTAALMARAAAQPGEAVLDLGCGAGELSLLMARQVGPTGRVLGLDISQPMLAVARRRGEAQAGDPAAAPLAWREQDASAAELQPEFDLLVSRFGAMFFDQPEVAFRNLRGALKPGGRLAILTWQELKLNAWAAVPMAAAVARFGPPDPAPPFAPGPFAFSDRERVLGILAASGFVDGEATPVSSSMRIGVATPGRSALDEAADYAVRIGPVARYLREREELRDEAMAVVREALAPYETADAVDLPAAAWIYSARSRVAP